MAKVKRILKWVFILLAGGFLLLQLYRPARTNPVTEPSQALEAHAQVSPEVAAVLDRSCNDCHSNKTRWPWYTNVSPVSWFVADHVDHGRREMNFSEWGKYPVDDRSKLLREICEQVEDGLMPLSSYTPLHPGSALTTADKQLLCDWINAERERLKK